MHYHSALLDLTSKMNYLIDEASYMYLNTSFPKFYKPLLVLTDLKHWKRKRRLRPFKLIGCGMFSIVVKHPDVEGVVFKIHGEDGYDEYLNYTRNIFSPLHVKVLDSSECVELNTELVQEKIYIKAIEELQPITMNDSNKDMLRNIELFEDGFEYSIENIPDLMLEHIHAMKNITVKTNTRTDIWHNIMQRTNGELVSIDPLVYSNL